MLFSVIFCFYLDKSDFFIGSVSGTSGQNMSLKKRENSSLSVITPLSCFSTATMIFRHVVSKRCVAALNHLEGERHPYARHNGKIRRDCTMVRNTSLAPEVWQLSAKQVQRFNQMDRNSDKKALRRESQSAVPCRAGQKSCLRVRNVCPRLIYSTV